MYMADWNIQIFKRQCMFYKDSESSSEVLWLALTSKDFMLE